MSTPFENLRTQLREAACDVQIADQFKTPAGTTATLMLVHPVGASAPISCLVIDEGEDGYRLFIESPGTVISSDVEAILQADCAQRLKRVG